MGFDKVVAIALAAFLVGCNIDMGLGCETIAGDYCLEQWEDGRTYYLEDRRSDGQAGGGAIDGTVRRLGWTNDIILVDRQAIASSDPDGWMVIDVRDRTVRGPIDEAEFRKLAEANGIRPVPASEAWVKLR